MTLAAIDTGFARAQRDYETRIDDGPAEVFYTCGYCQKPFASDIDDTDPCCPYCERHVCEWEAQRPEIIREAAAMLGRDDGPTDAEIARQWPPAALYAAMLTMNEDDGWRELAENIAVLLDFRRAELNRQPEPTFDAAKRRLADDLAAFYDNAPADLIHRATVAPPATLLGALARLDGIGGEEIKRALQIAALSGQHPILREKLARVGLLGGANDGR